MATFSQWVAGARPRTLPAAVAPVAVGTAAAHAVGRADASGALLALLVSLALQVGVNYANDYSDGIRGTDAVRVGPVRLVGQELADPAEVKLAAFLSFFFAALAGLALVAVSQQWWLLLVGVLCVLAAWYYTGGSRPYGYAGLGEVMVFVFFGLVATLGTQLTQAGRVTWAGLLGAVGVGGLVTAILVANNLRDIPTDREQGKLTLAVRLGDRGTRVLYVALVVVSAAAVVGCAALQVWSDADRTALLGHPGWPWALLGLLSLPLAVPLVRGLRSGATGRDLVPVLSGTGRLTLVYALLLGVGLVL
ncbi:1,4-dihydroxy-2-naphthoate polyprenyltransferase [Lapillicoccus jejuensis]|uniref:1,4-dihydroxy-2-naphthoate octaprenyltransferase n=1 Tax=Lapillicoccus jejuensis TaxID=402171 RepID=A0A542DX68_9MICO|nr:1,4-dihydroxy-2-naphthoate polyprenyltransferase [Lapillicoccus jejuensis]TQJ07676.1 1,4-dihydroxy-2-naphthoate prenyltransferase [Lapillicoccus jejuensis]